jgi:hypothetical protein
MQTPSSITLHLLSYADALFVGLTDDHLAFTSERGVKTAGWLIGHLCVTGDYTRRKIGRPPLTPKDWGPKFGPGTHPSRARADYPDMNALRAAFYEIYRDLVTVAPTLTPELLASPNPFEPSRSRFATLGDFTTWIMTGHLGYHLGQLSGWRGAASLR